MRTTRLVSALAALACTSVALAQCPAPTLNAPERMPLGAGPSNPIMADLDGDSDLDALVAAGNSVNVLVNDGQGGLTVGSTVLIGSGVKDIILTDVNNDGDDDIVALREGWVWTALGHGDATFDVPVTSTLPSSAVFSIAIGLIDADNIPDLVFGWAPSPPSVPSKIYTYLGQGDGTFVPHTITDVGQPVPYVALADVDDDGFLDIAAVHSDGSNSDTFHILLGAGDGTYTDTPAYTIAKEAYSIAFVDLDHDADPDVVVGADGIAAWFINDGTGTYAPRQYVSVPVSSEGVVVADVNDDGNPDLLAGADGSVTALFGAGDGTFPTSMSCSTTYSRDFAWGDLTGDNMPDLFACDGADAVFTIHGAGGFSLEIPASASGTSPIPQLADLDNDGILDAVYQHSDVVTILHGNADGSFDPWHTRADTDISAVAIGDYDGDGDLDVRYTRDLIQGKVSTIRNNNPGFTNLVGGIYADRHPETIAMADLDEDGIDDIIATSNSEGDVTVLLSSTGWIAASYAVPYVLGPVTIADIDDDHHLDLAVPAGDFASPNVTVLTNTGTGALAAPVACPTSEFVFAIDLGDIDGDNAIDLVAFTSTGYKHAQIEILGNSGGAFTSSAILAVPDLASDKAGTLRLADMDDDGDLDIVSGGHAYDTCVNVNDGAGTFELMKFVCTTGAHFQIADIDNDSDLDIVTGASLFTLEPAKNIYNLCATAPPPPACPGDLNNDLFVDIYDFAIFASNFATTSGATPADGDLDGDADVDVLDFAIFAPLFATTCP